MQISTADCGLQIGSLRIADCGLSITAVGVDASSRDSPSP
jgi:hypothetical protein